MKWLGVVVMCLLLPPALALEYYIDADVSVDSSGFATLQGATNLEMFSDTLKGGETLAGGTAEFTEKKGKYWLFTFDAENVSAVLLDVTLPKGAVINYIKSDLGLSISTKDNVMTFSFSGYGNPDIKIQYSIQQAERVSLGWVWALGILVVILASLLILKFQKNKPSKLDTIRPTLNETQLSILDALLQKGGEAKQTEIHYLAKIPKASLSRNVELLAQKEVIIKFYNGTSNFIKIHPRFR